MDTFNAYLHLLHKELKERFPYAVINVIVTGIGGETSDGGAKRFEKDVMTHDPDIITIDYALNDRRIGLAKSKIAWASNGKLTDLMSQVNHPYRKGHDLVVEKLLEWFPKS